MSVAVTAPSLNALTLSGSGTRDRTTNRLDVRLGGSGDAHLGELVARDAQATVNGSGRIVVNATNRLHAALVGNGAIAYSGSPTLVTTDVTGNGAVIRG